MTDHVRAGRASLMLVLVTVLWGLSFPWTKNWQLAASGGPGSELLASLTLIGLRMLLAVALLVACQPGLVTRPTWSEHLGGGLLGSVFFAGFLLQTWGLAWTTPALSAFFTCLSSAWVPLLCWLLGQRVGGLTLLGLSLALLGCAVLVDGWNLGLGEWLTLGASLLFAVQMLVLDRLGRRLDPAHFSGAFLAVTGVLGLAGAVVVACIQTGLGVWLEWTTGLLEQQQVLLSVVALAVLPTALGFHWMNRYQPRVSPSQAALIYLLEPIFASLFSVLGGYEPFTLALLFGGSLVLGGNLIVEVPRWLARTRVEHSPEA